MMRLNSLFVLFIWVASDIERSFMHMMLSMFWKLCNFQPIFDKKIKVLQVFFSFSVFKN